MRRRNAVLIAVAIVAVLVASAGAYFLIHRPAPSSSGSEAPTFTLTDIYGHPFSLSAERGQQVVLIEFTSISCSECQVVEKSLSSIYAADNATGASPVHIISVFIEPQFGDTIPALRTYHANNNVTWTMAQDTNSLSVSRSYGVQDIPDVVVVDKQGHLVYDVSGVQNDAQLTSTLTSAAAGHAAPISLVTVSVFALAALAGVTTFFSPCAFPMFPGYMSLFLGLSAGTASSSGAPKSYKGAARRALFAGSVTALGMVLVFLIIGVALIVAASAISGYIPDLLIVVGVVLIGLGALLLTNLQYWRIVTPLQRLWARIRGGDGAAPTPGAAPAERSFYVKLFGYGTGYAAAAAGCVAPVIFSAIIAGLALGLLGGILSILIYSATAALLMVVVTVVLAMAGKRYTDQLKAWTPIIKKVSAVALVIVGAYLIYFYYSAWGFV